MDEGAARKIVVDTFQNSFDKDRFIYFAKNLLNTIDESKAFHARGYIKEQFKQQAGIIKTYERVGTYTDSDGKNIDILIVYLEKEKSIEKARVTLRNFVADYLKQRDRKDAGLVAFVSPDYKDWRFSLIKMDYNLEKGKSGKVKIVEEFTSARRWSFLVGENESSHTAKIRLAPIIEDDEHNPTLKELEDAFNIEKVTKEFFEKYRELFLWAKESFDKILKEESSVRKDFEAKGINTVDFTKKLLGQIVFLYFLQKKGWFGVERDSNWGTGPKNFLRELFDGKHSKYKNFFNDILEPLFYEALADGERQDNFYSRFNCKIPFLNGGLFDPINNYDWVHTDINLPNELFSNEYKTKEGDIGNGILDIFDRYNFTVKEDEPLEKEVAVDPEMLGKVFENLLEVKDRKSKGTYYTPREIVHYMCEQSLLNYLSTEFEGKVKKEEVEKLIKYGESVIENEIHTELKGKETKKYNYKLPESIRKNSELIDEKLADIKICDPAVGSGAFPVGMMNEIIKVRSILSAYINDKKNRTIYDFKRNCIQNSLYGVDLDPGAVEIAKLRLWLSLIVDEEDIRLIKPLPNLDYKIMQGNSLLDEFEGIKLFNEKLLESPIIDAGIFEPDNQRIANLQSRLLEFYIKNPEWLKNKDTVRPQEVRNLEIQLRELLKKKKLVKDVGFEQKDLFAGVTESRQIRDELERLHKKFFEETNKVKKDKIKQQIEKLEWELIEITLKEQNKISALKKLEEFKRSNIKPFFLWKLNFADVFQKKGGFDVVIANPPYIRVQGLKYKDVDIFKKIYVFAYKRLDISLLFFEKGIKILKDKGFLAYISSNQFLVAEYGRIAREKLLPFIDKIINFDSLPVFENALTYVSIFLISKTKSNLLEYSKIESLDDFRNNKLISSKIEKNSLGSDYWTLNKNYELDLLNKIKMGSFRLGEIAESHYGIISGKDDIFILNKENEKKLGIEKERLRTIIFPEDITKWKIGVPRNKIIYPYRSSKKTVLETEKELKNNSPRLYEFLLKNKSILQNRKDSRTDFNNKADWYGLVRFSSISIFEKSKIISPTIVKKNKFALDSGNNAFAGGKTAVITSDKLNEKFLLALLNSRLSEYFYQKITPSKAGGYHNYSATFLLELPVKKVSENEQKPFIKIVDKILAIAKTVDYLDNSEKQAKVKEHEHQIDQMVYKLYNLTPEEIKIVKNSK